MKMSKSVAYEPPKSGKHVATITRITDIGIQQTAFGEKPQVRVRFDVEERDSRGLCKFVTQAFTNSLHENSNFSKFFAQIGKPLPDGDIDTDSLHGIKFTLKLTQVIVDGKPRVRIESVAPLSGGNGDAR